MKNDLLKCLIILFLVILIDQLSKGVAINNQSFVANTGLMFGSFSNSNALYRVCLISCGSIFFVATYLWFIYTLSIKLVFLKFGLSLFFGGILSNAIDKVYLNFVVDFLPITISNYYFYANVADIFQIFGALIVLYTILFRQDLIWYPKDQRDKLLVNEKKQIIFGIKFALTSLLALIMISVFAFSYVSIEFASFSGDRMREFVVLCICLSLLFSVLIFVFALYLSHHFYGPVYKLKTYVDKKNWDKEFNLRENDQFKELESIVKSIKKFIK